MASSNNVAMRTYSLQVSERRRRRALGLVLEQEPVPPQPSAPVKLRVSSERQQAAEPSDDSAAFSRRLNRCLFPEGFAAIAVPASDDSAFGTPSLNNGRHTFPLRRRIRALIRKFRSLTIRRKTLRLVRKLPVPAYQNETPKSSRHRSSRLHATTINANASASSSSGHGDPRPLVVPRRLFSNVQDEDCSVTKRQKM